MNNLENRLRRNSETSRNQLPSEAQWQELAARLHPTSTNRKAFPLWFWFVLLGAGLVTVSLLSLESPALTGWFPLPSTQYSTSLVESLSDEVAEMKLEKVGTSQEQSQLPKEQITTNIPPAKTKAAPAKLLTMASEQQPTPAPRQAERTELSTATKASLGSIAIQAENRYVEVQIQPILSFPKQRKTRKLKSLSRVRMIKLPPLNPAIQPSGGGRHRIKMNRYDSQIANRRGLEIGLQTSIPAFSQRGNRVTYLTTERPANTIGPGRMVTDQDDGPLEVYPNYLEDGSDHNLKGAYGLNFGTAYLEVAQNISPRFRAGFGLFGYTRRSVNQDIAGRVVLPDDPGQYYQFYKNKDERLMLTASIQYRFRPFKRFSFSLGAISFVDLYRREITEQNLYNPRTGNFTLIESTTTKGDDFPSDLLPRLTFNYALNNNLTAIFDIGPGVGFGLYYSLSKQR